MVARKWDWRSCPRPTGERKPGAFRARAGILPAKNHLEPWTVSSCSAFDDRTRLFPLRVPRDGGVAQSGCVRPASGVVMGRVTGLPAGSRNRISNAAGCLCTRLPAFAQKPLSDPLRADRHPRWPGWFIDRALARDTATTPQTSPPPAGQSSVGPGHPLQRKVRGSIAWGERVGKKIGGWEV